MRAPNTPFGIELSEFVEIPREHRAANPWDPGASRLIFRVRELDEVLTKARGAPGVTSGARPVLVRGRRAVLVRDPDGYLVELQQASAEEMSDAEPGQIVHTAIGLTVEDAQRALELYRGLLGFPVRETWVADAAELALNGLTSGRLVEIATTIPGTAIEVVFADFTLENGPVRPKPFRWRIQDVGSPQLQLEVRGLDALIERTRAAGYRFLSVGGRPIQRPFGRFVFAIDEDNILVEYAEPAQIP
jgi:catechol 2,3-dioxygenase-like lactoylglutathione lyase family enzyme